MSDPIDYSRPVGWWCPVCGHDEAETDVDVLWNLPDWLAGTDEHDRLVPIHLCTASGWCIPVYLPIPEGQRPPAASEVEDAEVVTGCAWGHWAIRPNPQTWSGWHGNITDALIDEITGATE